jgi:cyclopropane-fatty-acyl-phospholipid synthase
MSEFASNARDLSGYMREPPRDRRLRLALHLAKSIQIGTLTLELPDGSQHHFEGPTPGPAATIVIKDPRMVTRLMFGGTFGLCEAYLAEMWDSPNVSDVLKLGTANDDAFMHMLRGKPLARFASWIMHRLRANTRKGAKRNIAEHYDLGNDFYGEWLDPSMTYSSALFTPGVNDLESAQAQKYRAMCKALELQPGMTVLEIGCGWGGFAELAAREFGVQVTGITLSRQQLAYAQARIAKAGLAGQVTFKLEDYRDTVGKFDRIASIEMFEAVGEKYWPSYFKTLHDRLKPGGRAGVQVITVADRFFADYRKTADFIQRYVFPGGMLPCKSVLAAQIEAAGLTQGEQLWFGRDYAETLRRWRVSFEGTWERIAGLHAQYDSGFKRLWNFYLCYCEVGFDAEFTDVGQIMINRA